MDSIPLPFQLVSPGLWRCSRTAPFPSLCPGGQHFSLGLCSPGSGDFPGVGGRGAGVGAVLHFRWEGRKKKKSWRNPSPGGGGQPLPWSPIRPCPICEACISFSSLASGPRAKLPGKSAFPLEHGASSSPLGLQGTPASSSITWELAGDPHSLKSGTRPNERELQGQAPAICVLRSSPGNSDVPKVWKPLF